MEKIEEVILFRQVIIILGLSFAINFPMRVFSGILIAHFRYDLSASIEVLKLAVRTILIVIFLKKGYGVLALASITFVVNLIGYVIAFIFAREIAKYIILSKTLIDKTKIKSLFKYSSFSFVAQIADKLRFNVDNFVITIFLGFNFVTPYSIATRLIRYFMEFIIASMGMLTPVFSQYEGRGDYEEIRKKFILTTKVNSYIAIFIGGVFILFGNAFIHRWVGRTYLQSYSLLLILVIPSIIGTMQSPSIQLLYGISKHKIYAIVNMIEGIANLLLSIMLVKKYGLVGVAWGTAIPQLIVKIFIQPVYVCYLLKDMNIDLHAYYFEILIPIVLKSSIFIILFWIIFKGFICPDYLNLLILISLKFVLFFVVVFVIGFNKEERNYFKNKFQIKT